VAQERLIKQEVSHFLLALKPIMELFLRLKLGVVATEPNHFYFFN
jgi:hypothetical protein